MSPCQQVAAARYNLGQIAECTTATLLAQPFVVHGIITAASTVLDRHGWRHGRVVTVRDLRSMATVELLHPAEAC